MTQLTIEKVRALLEETVPSVNWSSLGEDDSLSEAGLDSLDKATFIMKVEEVAGTSIPDAAYEEIDTPRALDAYLAGQG